MKTENAEKERNAVSTKKRKTTKKHFELFKREVYKWQDALGLKDWRISFQHVNDEECYGGLAYTDKPQLNRTITFALTKDWDDSPIIAGIKRAAFHETCELRLLELRIAALDRSSTKEDIDAKVHAVIRRLENIFFEEK